MKRSTFLIVAACAAMTSCTNTPTRPAEAPAPAMNAAGAAPATGSPAVPEASSLSPAAATPPASADPATPELPAKAPAPVKSVNPVAAQAKPLPQPGPVAVARKPTPSAAATSPPSVPSAPATAPQTATIAGHVQITAAAGQTAIENEVADAIVYFIPDAGAPRPRPMHVQIFTREKAFVPSAIAIPIGSTVAFPNDDEVLHNVFSVTPGSEFDLGLYGEGKSGDFVFRKAGVVTVNCNVHPLMQVSILVLDTPYFVHPSKSGDFQLDGLPSGPGRLMVWHPRASLQTFPLLSSATSGVALQLTLSKPRVAPHLNKEHKPYLTAQGRGAP
jgi:plastocyanin